uniref:Uncharacterized protein n=1 Tax=Anguilla anguilla TaxID=7936 RepID=A0A0E9PHC9_ANGAN
MSKCNAKLVLRVVVEGRKSVVQTGLHSGD